MNSKRSAEKSTSFLKYEIPRSAQRNIAHALTVSVMDIDYSAFGDGFQKKDSVQSPLAFEVANFLMERRDEIISDDVNKAKYFRAVVVSSFPADV